VNGCRRFGVGGGHAMPAIQRWAVDFDHLDFAAAQVPAKPAR